MNSHQQRVLQSFRRVQGWLAANPQHTESAPTLATQLEALSGVVERVTRHADQQQTQLAQSLLISKDEPAQRRDLLSYHMGSIVKVARALRGMVPGIGVLTLPRGNVQSAALIAAATAIARKAELYREVLVENGLPTDFVDQLDAATARLKSSLDARGLARAARTSATRGVEEELTVGRRIVAMMDATLMRLLRSQPAKLAEWRHVTRVTLKGSPARVPVAGVETSPTLVDESRTEIETSPTDVVSSPAAASKAA